MNILESIFNEFPKLETTNFILREIQEKDYKDIYDIYSNEEAIKYQQIKPMTNIEQAQKSVQWFLKAYKDKKFIRWCIADKNYNKVVGLITLHDFDIWNSKAEIGYMLNKKYWKQGIMSEAGETVIKYAFEEVGIHRIEALVHPKNIASNKLNMKLGFKKEGFKESSAYNKRTDAFEDRLIYGIINNI